jgi:hypothetical protein
MGGGLLQLVSYGAQDIYITGNPQITFWKVLYKRHTNFAMESIEVTFNGQADFNKRVTAVINRNADLMYRTYVQVVLPGVDLTQSSLNLKPASAGSTTSATASSRWLSSRSAASASTASTVTGCRSGPSSPRMRVPSRPSMT